MKEYTLEKFCIECGILFYESEVYQFAYSEEWLKRVDILDDCGNVIDSEYKLNEDAINDTLKRMHSDIRVEVFGGYIFV